MNKKLDQIDPADVGMRNGDIGSMKKPFFNDWRGRCGSWWRRQSRLRRHVLLAFGLIGGALLLNERMVALGRSVDDVAPALPKMPVSAMDAVRVDTPLLLRAQGRVTPHTRTLLVSEVSGSVVEVAPVFVSGGFVKRGELLMRLDDRNYVVQVKRAKTDLVTAEKLFLQEKGQSQVAYRQWERSREVARTEEATRLLLRWPQLEEAKANLDFAEAELARAQGDLRKTEIRAPYDGLIKRRMVDLGQYATPGSQLGEIVAVDSAEVRLAIPQERLAHLLLPSPGFAETPAPTATDAEAATSESPEPAIAEPVQVWLRASYGGREYRWPARLVRSENFYDESSHILNVVAQIDDPYQLGVGKDGGDTDTDRPPLLLGTFVEADIVGRRLEDVVTLPRHLLRTGNQVWLIDAEGRLLNREVEVINTGGDEVYVTRGIENGERICLTHVGEVLPGTEVTVVEDKRLGKRS